MVERLKIAVAKARAQRARVAAGAVADGGVPADVYGLPQSVSPGSPPVEDAACAADGTGPIPPATVDAAWTALEPVELNPAHLERNRIITHDRTDPAHAAFDVLRTRILRVFKKHGWTRLGITSPSKGCGKTFVASNLAFSLARHAECRTVLLDLDLRLPSLSKVLGVGQIEPIDWFLSGDVEPERFLHRSGENLALGLSAKKTPNPAETLLAPTAAEALARMHARLAPDIVIYDLPPMLAADDVLGFLPQLDCVLLVVGGGKTRPDEVTECERLLADQTHLLGVLMNKAEDASTSRYGYSAA
ncbi:MAG: CpsD/CapB family tyrosine-protein kinase [Pseudomonadota bacterium]